MSTDTAALLTILFALMYMFIGTITACLNHRLIILTEETQKDHRHVNKTLSFTFYLVLWPIFLTPDVYPVICNALNDYSELKIKHSELESKYHKLAEYSKSKFEVDGAEYIKMKDANKVLRDLVNDIYTSAETIIDSIDGCEEANES